jgi:hypothetical protein
MAQTAAQKAAAKRAEADRIAMQKAMEARGAAAKKAAAKEKTYIQSLEDPITSQYDPRIGANAGFDPAKVGVMTGSGFTTPTELEKEPKGKPGAAWIWNGKAWAKPAAPQDGKSYTWNDENGWTAQVLNTTDKTAEQVDSIAAITALMASYGIGDLAGPITNAVTKGYSTDTIELIMQDPNSTDPLATAFQKRFPANKVRAAAGKAVVSPSEYLRYERTYAESFKQFGVPDLGTQETFSSFIANDVSPAEVVDRVGLAVDRVNNADQATKDAIKNFYPMISQSDLVRSILNPAEGLPALKRKVQIAEVGGAAMAQGLNASLNAASSKNMNYQNVANDTLGATELAGLGITKERAQTGYENIAELLPRSEFLSSISQGADYTQKTAEQEEFQGLASAKRARRTLAETEVGRFSGSSGVNKTSLQGSKGSF